MFRSANTRLFSNIKKCNPILKNTSVKEDLEKRQHDFEVAPNDKSSNTAFFICKRFYAFTLLKGFRASNKTCKYISGYNKNFFLNSAVSDIKQNFSMIIPKNMKDLPSSYRILKTYKLSIGTRFIIASKQCVMKRPEKNPE